MAEKAKAKEHDEKENLPLVVEVLPGTANKGYVFALGSDSYGKTVEQILDVAINSDPKNRELKSIQDVVKLEYRSESKVTIDGKAVNKSDSLDKYASNIEQKQTDSGRQYKLLRIRVAKPQEGGYSFYL